MATQAVKTPSNGLKTANQKEKSQRESGAARFVFIPLSHVLGDRHFTERESFFQGTLIAVGAMTKACQSCAL